MSKHRLTAATAVACLMFVLYADVAPAQVGGGGRGPTLYGRNRNSAAVQWFAKSFGRNTRIRRFAEGRDVATGRPLAGVRTPSSNTVTRSSGYRGVTTEAPRPAARAAAPSVPATSPRDSLVAAPDRPATTRRTVDPDRLAAIRRQLPPGTKIIAIDGIPVE